MKLRNGLIIAAVLLGAAPASAAADTIAVSFSTSDLAEGVPALITVNAQVSGTQQKGFRVYIAPSGSACAPTANQEYQQVGKTEFSGTVSMSAPTTSQAFSPPSAGDYVACGYLLPYSFGDTDIPVATTAPPFHVRVANARLAISQAAVPSGGTVALTATYQVEASRKLYVDYRLAGTPCASTYLLDRQTSSQVFSDYSSGNTLTGSSSNAFTFSAPSAAGAYIVCGYVQSSYDDTTPDATATSTFSVTAPPPSPCDVAKADLASKQPAATRADDAKSAALQAKRSAQTKSEAAYRSYRRAKSAHRSRAVIRRLLSRYTRQKSAYRSALATYASASRTAKAADALAAAAESQVDSAC